SPVIFLERTHVQVFTADGSDTIHGCGGTGNRCDAGNTMVDRRAANGFFVEEGFATQRRVDDEIAFPALDVVGNVRPAFVHFIDAFDLDAGVTQNASGTARCDDLETHFQKIGSDFGDEVLVVLIDADKRDSRFRQDRPGTDLRLYICLAECVIDSHD